MKSLFFALSLIFTAPLWAQSPQILEALEATKDDLNVLWDVSMKRANVSALTQFDHEQFDLSLGVLKKIRETGAIIVRNNGVIQLRNVTLGSASSISISYQLESGDEWLGDFHTHPYDYESINDLPFSPRDFVNLMQNKKMLRAGYFALIKSGPSFFAMEIIDPAKLQAFETEQKRLASESGLSIFDYVYKKFYSINRGQSIQEIQMNSLQLIMGDPAVSGVKLWKI